MVFVERGKKNATSRKCDLEKKKKTHHCPEGAGRASTWSTSSEQRALAISDACESRRSPVGQSALPLVGAMSFSAAATQSNPLPAEETFDAAAAGAGAAAAAAVLDEDGAGAGLAAVVAEEDDDEGEGAGDAAAAAATTEASLALGAANGLTVGPLAPVTIASAGAAKPSAASLAPGGGIPAPRSAPLAAAASSSSAGK